MAVAIARSSVAPAAAELRVQRWRGRPDLLTALALTALAVALLAAPLPAGERVIPLAAVVAVTLGWGRSLLERWTIRAGVLSHHGWLGARSLTLTPTTTVTVTDDEHGPAEFVLTDAGSRVALPLDELRRHPAFAEELLELLGDAASSGLAAALRISA